MIFGYSSFVARILCFDFVYLLAQLTGIRLIFRNTQRYSSNSFRVCVFVRVYSYSYSSSLLFAIRHVLVASIWFRMVVLIDILETGFFSLHFKVFIVTVWLCFLIFLPLTRPHSTACLLACLYIFFAYLICLLRRRLHDVSAQRGRGGKLRTGRLPERHHAAQHEQLLVGDAAAALSAAEFNSERAQRWAHGEFSRDTNLDGGN